MRVVADLVPGSVLERDHDALTAFELATAGAVARTATSPPSCTCWPGCATGA